MEDIGRQYNNDVVNLSMDVLLAAQPNLIDFASVSKKFEPFSIVFYRFFIVFNLILLLLIYCCDFSPPLLAYQPHLTLSHSIRC